MSSIINYKDRMIHTDCDRLIGKPTYDTIRNLEYQIIANSTCATTVLGGGAHRYLGLVKTPTQYALISATAFVRPAHPGPSVAHAGTAAQIAAAERTDKENLRLYLECESIERTLKQQIISAIDRQYLRAIINTTTQDIQLRVDEIFQYLYRT